MKEWMFDAQEMKTSPSRKDGIDKETEDRYRREGVKMIMDIGTAIGLTPYPSLATAAVFFHRFYMYHSFKEFSRYLTSVGCLFLAGKVEETPKKCRDVVETAKRIMNEQQFLTLSKTPSEEIMSIERVLLQTVKFDLQVDHPYRYLLRYAKCLKVDKAKVEKVVQMAWTFVNDSMSTTLCLQWEPEIIAIALMYLATRLTKVEITDWSGKRKQSTPSTSSSNHQQQWWDQFVENLTKEIMEEICHKVLDLYSQQAAAAGGTNPVAAAVAAAAASAHSSSSDTATPPQHGRSSRSTRQTTATTAAPVYGAATPLQTTASPYQQTGRTPRGTVRPTTATTVAPVYGSASTLQNAVTAAAAHIAYPPTVYPPAVADQLSYPPTAVGGVATNGTAIVQPTDTQAYYAYHSQAMAAGQYSMLMRPTYPPPQ